MKKILIGLLVIVVVIVGGVFFYFDSIIKNGIETAGSSALQTQVRVASVGISPFSGSGGIRELSIANPEGFEQPYAMQLGGLDVSVDVGSVFSDVIVIDSIVIERPQITYETRITTDNIRTLLGNIGGDADSDIPEEAGSEAGKRIVIRDFQMREPLVSVHSRIGSAQITIPDLHLQNIGEEDAAVTVAEAARQIIRALNQQLIRADIPNMEILSERVDEEVERIRERANDLGQDARDQLENLRDNIPNPFQRSDDN